MRIKPDEVGVFEDKYSINQQKIIDELREKNAKLEAKNAKLEAENEALRRLAVLIYNQGYGSGHNDTVESCYTDIHSSDMNTYHADVVAELLNDALTQPDPQAPESECP